MTQAKLKSTKQLEVERIIGSLSQAIAQHRLRPGQRLVEAQIVEALGANRNHVQTALQRMTINRIVTVEPNKGSMVAKPSAQEAKEVFAARRVIERGIVEAITPEILFANKKKIDNHMRAEQKAVKANDRRIIVKLLSDFHTLLAEICGNSVLKEMFDSLIVRSCLIVALYQRNDIPSCASDEHQQVLTAIMEDNKEKAVDLMLHHLDDIEKQLMLDDESEPELNISQALKDL